MKTPKIRKIEAVAVLVMFLVITPTVYAISPIQREPATPTDANIAGDSSIAETKESDIDGIISPAPGFIWFKVPIENCGLAGVTEANIQLFLNEHTDELNTVATYIAEHGIDEILDDLEEWAYVVVQGYKEQYELETFRNLIVEFGTLIDCSQADYDGDGIVDPDDPDDDNDGIPDSQDNEPAQGETDIYRESKNGVLGANGWLYHYLTAHPVTELIACAWDFGHALDDDWGAPSGVIALGAALALHTIFDDPTIPLAQEQFKIFVTMVHTYGNKYEDIGVNPYIVYDIGKGTDSRGWINLAHTSTAAGVLLYQVVQQT